MPTIDLDIFKIITSNCPGAHSIEWRISASGLGFHIRWMCHRFTCPDCQNTRRYFDDQRRFKHDAKRPYRHQNILWDVKQGVPAGPWHKVTTG